MTKKKTNKLVLAAVVVLSLLSFQLNQINASKADKSLVKMESINMEEIQDDADLFPQSSVVKEIIEKIVDLLVLNL